MWFLALAVLTFFFREDDLIFLPFFFFGFLADMFLMTVSDKTDNMTA